MAKSNDLIRLLERDYTNVGTQGALTYFERHHKRDLTSVDLQLLAELKATERRTSTKYVSPIPQSTPVVNRAEFSASDLAWLARIPTDPSAVSDDDVRNLVRLEAQAIPRTGDERLIRSIVEPVRRLHERRSAEAELTNAKAAAPNSPSETWKKALTAAYLAEQPALDAYEARAKAQAAIDGVFARQVREHARRLAEAEQAVAKNGPVAA